MAITTLSSNAEGLFKQIGLGHGLPNSSIFVIHQDKLGFMWFGTREGLVRFDGIQVKDLFSHDMSARPLHERMITDIAETAVGDLFVSVWGTGVYKYYQRKGKLQLLTDSRYKAWPEKVWTMLYLKDGKLLAGTTGHGLYIWLPELEAWQNAADIWPLWPPSAVNIRALAYAPDGTIWASTDEEGMIKLNPITGTVDAIRLKRLDSQSKPPLVFAIAFGFDKVWLGSEVGLFSLNDQDGPVLHSFPNRTQSVVRALAIDPESIWIGTDGHGLYRYHPNIAQYEHFDNKKGTGPLSSSVVFSLFRSEAGQLWVGTNKGGVNLYVQQAKRLATDTAHVFMPDIDHMVMALHQDRKGNTWVGTDGAGMFQIPAGTKSLKQVANTGAVIKSIFEDSFGQLYAGTYSEGMKFLRSDGEWRTFDMRGFNGLVRGSSVWAFAEDSLHRIWVGLLDDGVRVFNPRTHQFIPVNDTSRRSVLAMSYHPRRGRVMVGSLEGLYEVWLDGHKVVWKKVVPMGCERLVGAEVKALFLDRKGNLWVGMRSRGLVVLDDQLRFVRSFDKTNGLVSNSIAAIREDDQGLIWVSGSTGVHRIDPENFSMVVFSEADGLSVKEYLSESALLLHNGRLAFGGVFGVDVLDPASFQRKNNEARVFFTQLKIANKTVIPGEKDLMLTEDITFAPSVRLAYHQNPISLDFVAIDYDSPSRATYAYLLEELDDQWNFIGPQRSVTFINLSPGNYTLRIRTANQDGVFSPFEAKLNILVVPPWWKTWPARILILLVLVSIGAFFLIRKWNMAIKRRAELETLVKLRTTQLEIEKGFAEQQNRELIKTQKELLRRNTEILHQKDELERISKQLHEADQLKINFFTTISHEIRTPLTLMISPVHEILTKNVQLDQWVKTRLLTVQRNLLNLIDLVNQLLEFRRLEEEPMTLQAFPQNLEFVLKQMIDDASARAEASGLRLELEIVDNLPDIWIDLPKFQKIINNLLSNALKFTESGGCVKVSLLHFDGTKEGAERYPEGAVCIRVSDNGIGFPKEEAERIFELFYQSPEIRHRGYGGTGLGLSIARQMAQLHHGTLKAWSPDKGGAVFELTLPVGQSHLEKHEQILEADQLTASHAQVTESPQPATILNNPRPGRAGRRKTILLAEDNQELQQYIVQYLSSSFNVLTAGNGDEAWALIQSRVPDIVLSDIIMPQADGIELLKRIKNHPRFTHLPVIMLTAKTTVANRLEGLGLGADDYITKPFTLDELSLRIQNLLNARSKLRERFRIDASELPDDLKRIEPDASFVNKLNAIMEQHYRDEHFGVSELLARMGVSRSVLHEKLKRLTGMSASQWMRVFRLRKAAQMLQQEGIAISDVAWQCGFSDPAYFIRCFREHYQVTPGAYRANGSTTPSSEQ